MLGAVLGALAAATPAVAFAASPGGLTFDDPLAPSIFPDGSTLSAPPGELVGDEVTFRGTVAGTRPGAVVEVHRLDPLLGWVVAATATVGADGTFTAAWKAVGVGRTALRVSPAGQATISTATTAVLPTRPLTLYRPARVTWYGPGFFGRRTACGQRLTTRLLGVAHRTLPCGTLVELFKDGRTITVPVVDRGPFRHGARYDLTAATARALDVRATTTIGVVEATPAVG
jgi:hypothetical protein